ncbi:MAG TPA: NAD(P)-dependent oxidoreductase [Anaeromyxobacteraceae bacterium]|nr:NAD(P)-dependent oxidoreductase [Anaeromyxobacteraceae bacterium]
MPPVALLTGTPGGILDAVSRRLAEAGWETRHVPLPPDGAAAAPVRRADAVVHVGVRTPRDLDEEARVRVEAAAAFGAAALARETSAQRLLHVSTTAVYGRPRNLPCREGELKDPRTAFERIRWRAEQASWSAFRRGAPLTVLRPTLLYGPGLRGGPVRALALVSLFNQGKRRVPILRRGPVAHLVHVEDLARAVLHVLERPDDRDVVGRAFNVGDEAPLPLAEHVASALSALGYEPGKVLPSLPRLTALLLWLFRSVPDRALLDRVNRRFHRGWRRVHAAGGAPALWPRVEREALHWMSTDHYYDTSRLQALGWRAAHPVSIDALPAVVRSLVSGGLLPEGGASRAAR